MILKDARWSKLVAYLFQTNVMIYHLRAKYETTLKRVSRIPHYFYVMSISTVKHQKNALSLFGTTNSTLMRYNVKAESRNVFQLLVKLSIPKIT